MNFAIFHNLLIINQRHFFRFRDPANIPAFINLARIRQIQTPDMTLLDAFIDANWPLFDNPAFTPANTIFHD